MIEGRRDVNDMAVVGTLGSVETGNSANSPVGQAIDYPKNYRISICNVARSTGVSTLPTLSTLLRVKLLRALSRIRESKQSRFDAPRYLTMTPRHLWGYPPTSIKDIEQ